MTVKEITDRYYTCAYLFKAFELGLANMPLQPISELDLDAPLDPLGDDARNVWSVMLDKEIQCQPIKIREALKLANVSPPDLRALDHPVTTMGLWHAMGAQLLYWLVAERSARLGRVDDYCRVKNIPLDQLDTNDEGLIATVNAVAHLPTLDTFLAAVSAVAASCPRGLITVRRLNSAADAIAKGADADAVWERVTRTHYLEPRTDRTYNYRLDTMYFLRRAMARDVKYAADGRTQAPYWKRETGELFLHNRKLLAYQTSKAEETLALLDAFEAQDWPERVEFPVKDKVDNLRGYVQKLNNKQRERCIQFGVQESRYVTWKLIG